jgi:lysophospholipase L1-like esterase
LILALLETALRLASLFGLLELPRQRTIREMWAQEGWTVDKDPNWALLPDNTSMRGGVLFNPDLILLETNFNDRRCIPSREYEDGEYFYHSFYYSLRAREILDGSFIYRGLRRILVGIFGLSRNVDPAAKEFDYRYIDMDNLRCRVEPERYRDILRQLMDISLARGIPVILIPLRDPPSLADDITRASSLADAGNLKESYYLFKNVKLPHFYTIIVAKKANEILRAHGRDEKLIKTVPVQVAWMGTDGNIPVYPADPYVEIMEEAARERNVSIVGLDSLVMRQKELYLDYIHLNEEGHRLLAEKLFEEMRVNNTLRVPVHE